MRRNSRIYVSVPSRKGRHAILAILIVALVFILILALVPWRSKHAFNGRITPPADRRASDPVVSVRQIVVGLREDHPGVLWDALPRSWQEDIRNVLVRIDRRTHDRIVHILTMTRDVLRDRRDFLLETPTFRNPQIDRSAAGETLDALVQTLDACLKSRLSRPGLADIDAKSIDDLSLVPLVRKVFPPISSLLAETEVTTVSQPQPERAVVQLTSPQGLSVSLDLVLIEQKWVPVDWAKGWHEWARALDGTLKDLSSDASNATQTLAAVELRLDRLKNARTQQDFDLAWQDLISSALLFDRDDTRGQ